MEIQSLALFFFFFFQYEPIFGSEKEKGMIRDETGLNVSLLILSLNEL